MQEFLSLIKLSTVIDYTIIGLVLYFIFSTLKGTRAAPLVLGFVALYLFKTVFLKLGLTNTTKVLSFLFDNIVIFVLIMFQEEIRQIINRVRQKWSVVIGKNDRSQFAYQDKIVDAIIKLSKQKVGALIVLQGEMDVDDHISAGTKLDAEISEELILTIFENYSVLHDGAIIIKENKIMSAASVLPLSKNKTIDFRLGTRHRAAIGASEELDCLVLIVSEESGKIRVAEKGKVIELSEEDLKYKVMSFYKVRESVNYFTKLINKTSILINRFKK